MSNLSKTGWEVYDNLQVLKNSKITEILDPEEEVIYSNELYKINKKKHKQKRKIVITTHNLYNINEGGFQSVFQTLG